MVQNFEEQCGGIFTADIYLKIIDVNVLNNFDKCFFIFFSRIFEKYLQIKKEIFFGIKNYWRTINIFKYLQIFSIYFYRIST